MKLSKILAASAAASVILTLCSCAGNSSSSPKSGSSSAEVVQTTTKKTTFTTEDEMFTIELNDRFSKFEGVYPADFEFLFVDSDTDTTVGILEMSESHITPKYYCDSVKGHYEELYGSVKCTESDENGLPAYLLEAKFIDEESEEKNELIYYHKAIGYGNGDLFILAVTVPQSTPEAAPKAISDIMAGVTYHGDPLKTETEVHDTEYFSITADKDWFFHSKNETSAAIRPNIAETTPDHYGSLKISVESGSTAKELSAKDAEDFSAKDKIINVEVTEGTKCLGRDAICVSCVLTSDYMDLKREIFYFDNNGVSYKVQILAPTDGYEEFIANLDAVYDMIEIK